MTVLNNTNLENKVKDCLDSHNYPYDEEAVNTICTSILEEKQNSILDDTVTEEDIISAWIEVVKTLFAVS